ncbi:MAG: hypothetical protein ACI4KI_03840 [Candidatus Fimenecus sp.]
MEQNTPFETENNILTEACNCHRDGCEKTENYYADISVPLEMIPKTTLGDVSVECCGESSAECIESRCANTCTVNVTQKVNIKIPISYQVSACMGEPVIDCDGDTPCCQ